MAKGSGGTRASGTNVRGVVEAPKPTQKAVQALNEKYGEDFSPKSVFGKELTGGDSLGVRRFRAFLAESRDIYDINMTRLNEALAERTREATVDISDIYPIQRYLNKERVAEYIANPGANKSDRGLGITGYRLPNGKVILDDGHHRVAAALIKGEKTVKMGVVDVSEYYATKWFKSLSKKK